MATIDVVQPSAEAGVASQATERLGWLERIAYGFGDFGSNMTWQLVSTYLLFFYTDVYGISAVAVGSLLLINRIWDGINDPMIGWITDRVKTRWGHYRPWLILGGIPDAIVLIVAFTTPNLSAGGKIIYAWMSLFLLEILYTLLNIPIASMIPAMTRNPQERSNLASAKMIGATLGILVTSSAPALVARFASPQAGWRTAAIIFATVAVVAIVITFAGTRERFAPRADQKLSVKDGLRVLGKNGPMWIIMLSSFLGFFGMIVRNSVSVHYFRYNIGAMQLASTYFALGAIGGILGALSSPFVSRWLDKNNTRLLGVGIFIVAAVTWYLGGDAIPLVLTCIALEGFGLMLSAVAGQAQIADTVDYAALKTGTQAAGVVTSTFTLANKLAYALGGAAAAFGLAAAHYVPNAAQTPATLATIRNLVTLVPAACAVLTFIVILFYRLDRRAMAEITARLQAIEQARG